MEEQQGSFSRDTKGQDIGGMLTGATGAVADLVGESTLPAPIRKNMFKAFDRLCSAVMGIPVAYLEGVALERQAEAQARAMLIRASADQIASDMNLSAEYAQIAGRKYGNKILREQVNLDKISEVAAQQLREDIVEQPQLNSSTAQPEEVENAASIDEDWLNTFESEAREKSSEEMQILFGRILASEIQKPTSFSTKTLRTVSQLDSRVANLFRRLCSLCITLRGLDLIIDQRVPAVIGNASLNSLNEYGLGYGDLNLLQEHGLIVADYNSYFEYQACICEEVETGAPPFIYQGKMYFLKASPERPQNQDLRVHGVAFSQTGRELSSIVDIEPLETYTTGLQSYFAQRRLTMVELSLEGISPENREMIRTNFRLL
ncbi:MAG: DUF2806 domain-containing protein [Phormidesmis sp.]